MSPAGAGPPRAAASSLPEILASLESACGPPQAPPVKGAFEMILWENVAYLVEDDRRAEAFRALARTVGTRPEAIVSASQAALLAVARLGGMHPERRAGTLRRIAELALEAGGDLDAALDAAPREAKRLLATFPSIGGPGAEKILLFARDHPVLALESNGLRVLLRLGLGAQKKSYAASYRSAQEAATAGRTWSAPQLRLAHLLLRRHGKELCKTTAPRCAACPLAPRCPHYQETVR